MKNHFTIKSVLTLIITLSLFYNCSNETLVEETEVLTSTALKSNLDQKFQLGTNENLVMEHSWGLGGCSPCATNLYDGDLSKIVGVGLDDDGEYNVGEVPTEDYFYENTANRYLVLKCEGEQGKRIEFKQNSQGPLDSFSEMDFWAVYYDIPDGGVTIAQVHNRGGSPDKPFFRLVLHKDHLETVRRVDPEVSASQTDFNKSTFYFEEDYDKGAMRVVLKKKDGNVSIKVKYDGDWIINEVYAPEAGTKWITDEDGIAKSFYLKAGLYNDSEGGHDDYLRAKFTTFKFDTDD